MGQNKKSVAVIGGGISGISASYLLQKKYEVTLFEADSRLGGHTHTISCTDSAGKSMNIDTGFIVLNDCNYPVLHELFEHWEVPLRWSDMSFSYHDPSRPFYYAGKSISGLFAQTRNIINPAFYSFLLEIRRFCTDAIKYLGKDGSHESCNELDLALGEFLEKGGYSHEMCNSFLYPMGSAIWSSPINKIREFPARAFFNFFRNHGLLSITKRPEWQTVCGGSSAYLSKFLKHFSGTVLLSSPVRGISRHSSQVTITTKNNESSHFDFVVLACHADDALSILEDPTDPETGLLGAWTYEKNEVILHTDESLMPPDKRAWASWNYLGNENSPENPAVLTYYMNLLQGLKSPDSFLVTLNHGGFINPDKIIKKINYQHPVYTPRSIASQKRLHELQGIQNTYYCGSYFGNGFHEDGARSGAQIGLYHGITL